MFYLELKYFHKQQLVQKKFFYCNFHPFNKKIPIYILKKKVTLFNIKFIQK
jgi:hypothetical protein